MIWLQTPPWGRWLVAILIAATAVWVEFRPDSSVDRLFATTEIATGETLDTANTELRPVPAGLFEDGSVGSSAVHHIGAGDPILDSSVTETGDEVPAAWWVVELALPADARRGQTARVVLLDSGDVVEAIVTSAISDDSFGTGMGSVAVGPGRAAEVAAAAASGRVAVMIKSG